MPSVSVHMSKTTGHGPYGPTSIIATQSKVFIEGLAVLVNGDKIIPHPHDGTAIASQSKMFIQGKPVIIIGDQISCGDMVAQGRSKVFLS